MTQLWPALLLLVVGCQPLSPPVDLSGAAVADMSQPADLRSTQAPDLLQPAVSTYDMAVATSPPPDMADPVLQDMAQPAPPPDMAMATPVMPGGHCTTSSDCFCYSGCSGTATSYGYCVTDFDAFNQAQGKYCVVAWWTYATLGPYNGYWFLEFGDQTKVLPGFTPPGNGYVYGCSQDYSVTTGTIDPKIPPNVKVCYQSTTSQAYLEVVP